MKYNYTYVLP